MSIWVIIGLLFWVFVIGSLIYDERFFGSFWVLLVPSVVIGFLNWESTIAFISNVSIASVLMYSALYLILGYGVALVKWAIRSAAAAKAVKQYDGVSIEYALSGGRFDGLKAKKDVTGVSLVRSDSFPYVIGAWVVWWPFVLVAMMLSDVLNKLLRFVTEALGGTFQAITNYFMKQVG